MTFDKWSLKSFLTIDEIAKRLSAESKDDTTVSWSDVLSLALDGHLPLVVKIPPKTHVWGDGAAKDGRRPTIEGICGVVMEGERGSNARRAIDRDYRRLADLPRANDEGIGGIWVERDGEQWKLDPYSNLPKEVFKNPVVLDNLKSRNPALAVGCIWGARTAAVEQLLAQEISSYKKPIEATWQDVTITLINQDDVQITVHNKVLPVTSYEALGFEDQKRKQGTMAWETFKRLAEAEPTRLELPSRKPKIRRKDGPTKGGPMENAWIDETGDTDRVAIQNRIREINKKLREAFASRGYVIPDEPLPLVLNEPNQCYEPTPGLRITVSAHY